MSSIINGAKGITANFVRNVQRGVKEMPLALPQPKPCKPIVDIKKATKYSSLMDMECQLKKDVMYYPNSRMTMYHNGKEWILTCGEEYLPKNTIINRINQGNGVFTTVRKSKNHLKIEHLNSRANAMHTYEEIIDDAGRKTKKISYQKQEFYVGYTSPCTAYRAKNSIPITNNLGGVKVNIIETVAPDGTRILREEYIVPSTGIHVYSEEKMAAAHGVRAKHYFIKEAKFVRETEITKSIDEAQKKPFKVELFKDFDVEAPSDMIKTSVSREDLAAKVFDTIMGSAEAGISGWEELKNLYYCVDLHSFLV